MFPDLRFPEFSGEWEKHTIGELAIKVGSSDISSDATIM